MKIYLKRHGECNNCNNKDAVFDFNSWMGLVEDDTKNTMVLTIFKQCKNCGILTEFDSK